MNIRLRRGIGLVVTAIYLVTYMITAAMLGDAFVRQESYIKMTFFLIAGIVWVIPLKPIYDWMRPKPGEVVETEKPPSVSKIRK